MNAYDVYREYLAIKSHFTRDSYDYFRYGGKVSASISSFEKRKDRYYFEKLAKKRDPRSFILANLVDDPQRWIGSIVNDNLSEVTYKAWLKRRNSLSYTFTEDISKLDPDFDSNFKTDGGHPFLLKLYIRQVISLESLIILVHLTSCFPKWNKVMSFDPVWQQISMKMKKYQPFMKYDLEKMRQIVKKKFS